MSVNIQSPFDPSILGAAMQGFIAYGNRWAQRDIAQAELASQSADRVVAAFTNAFNKAQDLKVAMEQLKIEREKLDILREEHKLNQARAQAEIEWRRAQIDLARKAIQPDTTPHVSGSQAASGSQGAGAPGATQPAGGQGPEAAPSSPGNQGTGTGGGGGGRTLDLLRFDAAAGPGGTQGQWKISPLTPWRYPGMGGVGTLTSREQRIIEGIRQDVDTLRMNDQMLAFNIFNSTGMPRIPYGSYLRPLA